MGTNHANNNMNIDNDDLGLSSSSSDNIMNSSNTLNSSEYNNSAFGIELFFFNNSMNSEHVKNKNNLYIVISI